MMLFKRHREKKAGEATQIEEKTSDKKIQEELSELSASEKPSKVHRAKSEAEAVISNATIADIRGVALMERGRCPECGGRTEGLLFTAVCPLCGWYRQIAPEGGHCLVYLDTGETISCDRLFNIRGEQILCVKKNVVLSQVARSCIRRIDYVWGEGELEMARERFRKEHFGVCAWCGKYLEEAEEEDAPFEEFVAFGAFQERHLFCSRKCLDAFRKQYPVRIHRNCYETECNSCNQCIKRYDTRDFKRIKLE